MGFGSNKGFTPGDELTVREADSDPSVSNVKTIVVSNGTLTDNGDGQVTITTGGGGGAVASTVGWTGPGSDIIATTGSVGIGTDDPGTLLQIEGAEPYLTLKNSNNEHTDGVAESRIIFEDHTDAALAQIQGSHDGTSDDTKGDLIFSTNNGTTLGEKMRISSLGHVGIGGSPDRPLHVLNSLEYLAKFESTDPNAAIIIQDNTSDDEGNRINVVGNEMGFFTSGSERVRIDDDGLVGIGATNPLSQLHISGTTLKQVLTLENNGGRVDLGIAGGGSDILPGSAKGDLVISNESGNDILFGTQNAQRMIIDKEGNVGIGPIHPTLDPPSAALTISGSTLELRDDGTANSNPGVSIKNDVREYKLQVRGAQSDLFAIRDSNAGANRLSVLTTGLIGLGVDDPDAALEIFNTSDQLKLSYDASNFATQVVDPAGALDITTAGGADSHITLDPASQIINFGSGSNAVPIFNYKAAAAGIIENRYVLGGSSHFTIVVDDDTTDKVRFGIGDGKHLILTTQDNRKKSHGHAAADDPTLFIHSSTDPTGGDDTQWVSLTHNQTNAVMQVGSGSLVVTGSLVTDGGPQLILSYDADSNLNLYHNGSNAYVESDHGDIILKPDTGNQVEVHASSGGTAELQVVGETNDRARIALTEGANARLVINSDFGASSREQNGIFLHPTDAGNQLILGNVSYANDNHDHPTQTNPTLFVHSATDVDSDNTQWVSLAHNQTNAVLDVGKGSLIVSGAIGDVAGQQGQLRIAYDGSNYADFYVNNGGDLFLTSSGGDTTFSAAATISAVRNGDVYMEVDSGGASNSNRKFRFSSDNGASNGQGSIGSQNYPNTILMKGHKPLVGIGGVTEPLALLHLSASHSNHNGGPVLQVDHQKAGLIFEVTGSTTLGAGKAVLSGSFENVFATATAAGAGWNPTTGSVVGVSKINGEIVTTMLVDVGNLAGTGSASSILGAHAGGAAYLTQITTAKNGIIYKAEVSCVKAPARNPAGGNVPVDIDVVVNADGTLDFGHTAHVTGSTTVAAPGATWTAGLRKESADMADLSPLVNGYVYLTNGGTAFDQQGSYLDGKLVIKLYGADF